MNRRDDNAVDDAELAPYLEGRDGVSAAYRASRHEEPPPALDALILQAARQEADSKTKPAGTPSLRNYYALAASLMLGLMLGTVFLDDSAEKAVTTSAPAAAPQDNQAATAPVTIATPEADVARQRAPQPAPAAAESTAIAAEGAPQRASDSGADATTQGAVAADTLFIQGEEAPAVEVDDTTEDIVVTGALFSEAEETPAPAATDSDTGQQEIMVTGSRIREVASYREDQQTWLEAIATMLDMLENITGDPEPLIAELEAERDLFEETYPDVDLDAALQELRER